MKVPTNIITGFLGSGKTTAIQSLLKQKPAHEKWAILVNEFGEIGIDGTILSDSGAIIKEVPGGCMCCAAGVPTSVALVALLKTEPDRLIVEPTGLGHPKKIFSTLSSEQFNQHIELKATVGLVDPRNLSSIRHLSNSNFIDQLEMADIIIGNKAEGCNEEEINTFHAWINDQSPRKAHFQLTNQGQFDIALLDMEAKHSCMGSHSHTHAVGTLPDDSSEFTLDEDTPHIRKLNKGQGFVSCGWVFRADIEFRFDRVFSLLTQISAERVKAVIKTNNGQYTFNICQGVASVNETLEPISESRVEIISETSLDWNDIEEALLGAMPS